MRWFLTVILIFLASTGFARERVALLIGNGTYALPGMSLKNPVNDADAMEAALSRLGFEVRTLRDADQRQMRRALDWLEGAAADAEMALVFYAGHGVQVAGENYLIGTDLGAAEQSALAPASITLGEIRQTLTDSGVDIGMVVLDACRDNPFAGTGDIKAGLATAQGGAGLLVAYATDPGNVAYDGAGDNSVFTSALLENLDTPGIDVRIMFGRVRQTVIRQTEGAQIPWVEEAVLGEHQLVEGAGPSSAPTADDVADWRIAVGDGSASALQVYLDRHPGGLFEPFARRRMAELEGSFEQRFVAGPEAATVLAAVDPYSVGAALDLLGYVSARRGLVLLRAEETTATAINAAQPAADVPEDLTLAFNAWRSTQPDPAGATPDMLLRDAARLAMFLAASTAQQMRTDLKALSAVETLLDQTARDFAQLRALAPDSAEGRQIVAAAAAQIAEIETARETISRRLDDSRAYYHSLVLLSDDNFEAQTTTDLLAQSSLTRSAVPVQQRLLADAGIFVQQVSEASNRPRGSMAWLADFVRTQEG
ncbi:MAG: caspase family protein [Pseudomonadota bacterium]